MAPIGTTSATDRFPQQWGNRAKTLRSTKQKPPLPMKRKNRQPKKQVTQKYNLTTFTDESLKKIVESSSSPAMVEAARTVLRNRNVPYPTPR